MKGPSSSLPGSESDGEYDEHVYRENWTDAMAYPRLGQFIYLIYLLLRQLDDALLLAL